MLFSVPRGMQDRAIARHDHPNDSLLLAPEHVSYYLAGWKETQNGVGYTECRVLCISVATSCFLVSTLAGRTGKGSLSTPSPHFASQKGRSL